MNPMNPTQRTDTPETDAEILRILIDRGVVDHRNAPENLVNKCRSMERERDELREAVRKLRDAKGRHHSQIAAEQLFKLIP